MPAKRRSKRSRPPRRKAVRAIPPGFGTVTPYLSIEGGQAAMEFYKRAFGARELLRQLSPDGKVVHGRLRIGSSIVLLSDVFPGGNSAAPTSAGTTTVVLHIYANDVDKLWQRAVQQGARVLMPLENQFWGERYGQLVDPFGHHWSLSMRVRMDPKERKEKERQAMAAFASGTHPGASGAPPPPA